jgi:perosamine synthetase
MLNLLIPFAQRLRKRYPNTYEKLKRLAKRFLSGRLGIYPKIMGNEVAAVEAVLKSAQWNMAYGRGLAHERLESAFAEYIGVAHAIAVGTGGMAIQMSLRALGMQPGDEVIHQVDTCSATAMAVMNAGVTPIFADISPGTFMLDPRKVTSQITSSTKGILATHMWGNPEDMKSLRALADSSGIKLIEDACLSLGTMAQGKKTGAWGDAAVFSFGCIKPIQGGEGGMIVTPDASLAAELRAMRHWGDRSLEFGVRDVTELSWNGRMSEIVAAVVAEQLKGYPAHLDMLQGRVNEFSEFLKGVEGMKLVLGKDGKISDCTFTQVVMNIDASKISKDIFWKELSDAGVPVWHANFELINTLSFFKRDTWKKWILKGDIEKAANNYQSIFEESQKAFNETGIGFAKMNFLSKGNFDHLKNSFEKALIRSRK